MKILNIDKYYYLKGGAERYAFSLADLLKKNGQQVIPFSQQDAKNFLTPYVEYFPQNKYRFFWSFSTADKLRKLIEKEKPDIAHVHLIYHHLTPSVLWVLKKKKIPIVMTVHDYKLICPNYSLFTQGAPCERCKGGKYYHAILHRCVKDSYLASSIVAKEMYFHEKINIYKRCLDLLIAPSEFAKKKFIEFGWPVKKITVIPHFIDLENKKPNFKIGDYILYCGRLSKEKGLDNLINAYYNAQLKFKLKIAGTGPLEKHLKSLVAKRNLSNNVEFLGHLNDQQLKRTIANSRFVVVPSLVWETFGLAALEAFAQGKTVIASDRGALPEIVKNKKTGIIFNSNLSQVLRELANDEEQIKQLSKNAYQLAAEYYQPQQHYEKIISIYHSLLRDRTAV